LVGNIFREVLVNRSVALEAVMRQLTLAYVYILMLWGLASTQSAAAACDPELVPLVGSARLLMQSASIRAGDPRGQRDAGISLTDALPSADRDRREAVNRLAIIYARGRGLHPRAYAWIRAALTLGVPEEDRDATNFKLGMIAERLGTAQTRAAERLATSITQAVVVQCERGGERYIDAMLTRLVP
jgi:hypothetical protein